MLLSNITEKFFGFIRKIHNLIKKAFGWVPFSGLLFGFNDKVLDIAEKFFGSAARLFGGDAIKAAADKVVKG